MQEKRLELSWYCYHTDLNRARLPIPPFLHTALFFRMLLPRTRHILSYFISNVNIIFEIFQKVLKICAKQVAITEIHAIRATLCIGASTVNHMVCCIIYQRCLGRNLISIGTVLLEQTLYL